MVLIICPDCGARYKLSEGVVARGARLRCAACEHRWVPEAEPAPPVRKPVTEADEEAAFAQVQAQMQARWDRPAVAAISEEPALVDMPETQTETDEAVAAPRSTLARTIVALVAGAALAIVAAGLWVGELGLGEAELATVPGAAALLAQFDPPAPVRVMVRGAVTPLPSGRRLLEVTGTIANPGQAPMRVPALVATLSGPRGVALRWTIPAPVTTLAGGRQVAFGSTVTGFPAEATRLAVRPGR